MKMMVAHRPCMDSTQGLNTWGSDDTKKGGTTKILPKVNKHGRSNILIFHSSCLAQKNRAFIYSPRVVAYFKKGIWAPDPTLGFSCLTVQVRV